MCMQPYLLRIVTPSHRIILIDYNYIVAISEKTSGGSQRLHVTASVFISTNSIPDTVAIFYHGI